MPSWEHRLELPRGRVLSRRFTGCDDKATLEISVAQPSSQGWYPKSDARSTHINLEKVHTASRWFLHLPLRPTSLSLNCWLFWFSKGLPFCPCSPPPPKNRCSWGEKVIFVHHQYWVGADFWRLNLPNPSNHTVRWGAGEEMGLRTPGLNSLGVVGSGWRRITLV